MYITFKEFVLVKRGFNVTAIFYNTPNLDAMQEVGN